ncbi:MAG: glycosyltransferase [Bacteroidia bacterium]
MKIAVFTHGFGIPTETFIYNEVKEISQMVDTHVLTRKRANSERFPFDKVEQIPFSQSRIRAKIQWELKKRDWQYNFKCAPFAGVLRSKIQNIKPALMHAHFGPEAIRYWDNMEVPKTTPFVISFHGYDASRMLRSKAYVKRIQQLCAEPNVSIICVSHFMKRQLAKAGISSPRTHILYYGTDCSFFAPESGDGLAERYTFLQVSSFREKKGHVYTLEAYARFKEANPNFESQLILGGDGPLLEEIKAKAASLHIEEEVHFPGLLSPTEAKALMQKADCFVHHSITGSNGDQEGIPNAIMEAMAMELPVLSALHSGIPELVESGENGFLIAEKNVLDYAEKMTEIIKWPKLSKNREKVLKAFERKQHAQSLLQIYQQSINSL